MSRQFLHRAVLPVSAVACGFIAVSDSRNRPRPRVWCEEDPRDWIKDEMKHKSMEEITMGQYGKWTRLWNSDWDGRNPREDAKKEKKSTEKEGEGEEKSASKKEYKPTVHLLLIRHGQYNLDSDENELTELGKEQSRIVGQRLKQMTDGMKSDRYGTRKIKFKKLISSDVLRAKQTAEIIHEVLGGEETVHYEDPDPILAEGWPCVPMPMSERSYSKIRPARLLEEGNRLEAAYRKYVHRARDHKKTQKKKDKPQKEEQKKTEQKTKKISEDYYKPSKEAVGEDGDDEEDLTKGHEYYIVVCHMNVIRYFVCRALQLPPEAWLRMGGENCGITEIIVRDDGGVSLARFGDNGHLTIEQSTFH